MSKFFSFKFTIVTVCLLCLAISSIGCSHKKTNRGHLFRCDWAFEYNRTPWIGCPPDSGCDDERSCSISGCSGCKDCTGKKGFRRHCGMSPDCTAKRPCCRNLGCGMWIDPSNPATFSNAGMMGGGVKACGLTPLCSPMKPCCLTPLCGKVVNTSLMQQGMISPLGGGIVYPGVMGTAGMMGGPGIMGGSMSVDGMPIRPTPVQTRNGEAGQGNSKGSNGGNGNGNSKGQQLQQLQQQQLQQLQQQQQQQQQQKTTVAGPNGLLISMGIVPGVSTITTGGIVAATGVTTPVGTMTPSGVLLPSGVVNNQLVIKACGMHPACSPGRPCGMASGCGMLIPVGMVSNNAVMLASALSTQHGGSGVMPAYGSPGGYVPGTVMQAGGFPAGRMGSGMLVNPITGQPISGLTMNGAPQMGYPPIGYAATGYSPKYPRYDGFGMTGQDQEEAEDEDSDDESGQFDVSPINQSQMPVPRFHAVPSKPAFQRSGGLTSPSKGRSRSSAGVKLSSNGAIGPVSDLAWLDDSEEVLAESPEMARTHSRTVSKDAIESAVQQAYLEGMSAAMEEVEEELDAKARKREKALMKEKVLKQAEQLQAKLQENDRLEWQQQQDQLAQREEEKRRRQELYEQQLEQEEARLLARQEARIRQEQLQQDRVRQAQLVRQPDRPENAQDIRTVNFNRNDYSQEPNVVASTWEKWKQALPLSESDSSRSMPIQRTRPAPPHSREPVPTRETAMAHTPAGKPNIMTSLSGLLKSNRRVPQAQNAHLSQPNPTFSRQQNVSQPMQAQRLPLPRQKTASKMARPTEKTPTQVVCMPMNVPDQETHSSKAIPIPVLEKSGTKTAKESPVRPPTTKKRPKKVLEVDDEDEDSSDASMIQNAAYIVRG